jgi:hypothetical protein
MQKNGQAKLVYTVKCAKNMCKPPAVQKLWERQSPSKTLYCCCHVQNRFYAHRYLMSWLSLQVVYLWRHVSSTAPPFILWWTNFEILFGPLHRSSPFIGEGCAVKQFKWNTVRIKHREPKTQSILWDVCAYSRHVLRWLFFSLSYIGHPPPHGSGGGYLVLHQSLYYRPNQPQPTSEHRWDKNDPPPLCPKKSALTKHTFFCIRFVRLTQLLMTVKKIEIKMKNYFRNPSYARHCRPCRDGSPPSQPTRPVDSGLVFWIIFFLKWQCHKIFHPRFFSPIDYT